MLKQVIEPARNFVCYPAIDIGPDLSIWRCFGTSKIFNKKLSDFRTFEEVCEYYQRVSRLSTSSNTSHLKNAKPAHTPKKKGAKGDA